MNEKLFQFIWQYSLYRAANLITYSGEKVTVIHAGKRNIDSGPDFVHAKVQIGKTVFAGNVELHLRSSDWWLHGHQHDAAYQNIILHVVLEHDDSTTIPGIPLLVLGNHLEKKTIEQYTYLLHAAEAIPCSAQVDSVPDIIKQSTLQRMMAERWELKMDLWKELLAKASGDWLQLLYEQLAINFGFRTNAFPFSTLAQSIPLKVLSRPGNQLLQVEALLFGQSGMLQKAPKDDYVMELNNHYQFLKQKYLLQAMPAHLWKFLRMRPANFPSIRIAQFAKIISQATDFFNDLIYESNFDTIKKRLQVTASGYWDNHYRLGVCSEYNEAKTIGLKSVENMLINTVGPIKFFYGYMQGNTALQEQAINLLQVLPAEKNQITRLFDKVSWAAHHAAQSQAQLQLYHQYCSKKRCLECSIGLSIIRQQASEK